MIEPGARRALSDPATTEIRFGDTTLALTPADRVVQAGEHYLSTRILGALLHLVDKKTSDCPVLVIPTASSRPHAVEPEGSRNGC